MERIYDHFLFFSDQIEKDCCILSKDESNHAQKVLRITKGSIIFVTDGNGYTYTCKIENIEKDQCSAQIIERKQQSRLIPEIHFFIGIPDKEAFEKAITGLVPLGITGITPVICDSCRKKWMYDKWDKYAFRFRKVIVASAKQSWNAWFPELGKPVSFKEALKQISGAGIVADSNGSDFNAVFEKLKTQKTFSCFIGPPEGFSHKEISELEKYGSHKIKLSNNRLRTELAAVVLAGNIIQNLSLTKQLLF